MDNQPNTFAFHTLKASGHHPRPGEHGEILGRLKMLQKNYVELHSSPTLWRT